MLNGVFGVGEFGSGVGGDVLNGSDGFDAIRVSFCWRSWSIFDVCESAREERPAFFVARYLHVAPRLAHREQTRIRELVSDRIGVSGVTCLPGISLVHLTFEIAQASQLARSLRV
jgi:hypothetical protein